MSAERAVTIVRHALTLLNDGAFEDLASCLSPTVTYRAPPHAAQFPGNVVDVLRRERNDLPGLELCLHDVFADDSGSRVVATALWRYGRLRSEVCLLFRLTGDRIDDITVYGGLGRILHDLGARRVA